MSNLIQLAKQDLLVPAGITDSQIQKILGNLLGKNIDYGDLYFQTSVSESWSLEDSMVKDGSFDLARGVGVRAISGEKTGFAYADNIILESLESAAGAARSITRQGGEGIIQIHTHNNPLNLYQQNSPLDSIDKKSKINLLLKADQLARQSDSRIKQVMASLAGEHEIILIIDAEGNMSADIRPLVRLNISVIAEQNGKRESGFFGGGGRFDYNYFLENNCIETYVNQAVKQAIVNLDAVPAPAGQMPVVLGPGWPGVLLHEAIGHGLEGDFNRKGTSAFSGRIGERVATPCCTVVDDGTLDKRRGSLNIDDEGTPTECTVLIENGILKNYMQDKQNAKLMKMAPTGNGRRESYAHLPMPRMTNTYMLSGVYDPQEIIKSVHKGLYAVNFGGGQVDITSGKFVFSANEAYLIENGKITRPVKGATLIGDGPEVLKQVSMLGNDLELDSGVGVCGKEGQSVPVGVGQPTTKVDMMTVGGTEG